MTASQISAKPSTICKMNSNKKSFITRQAEAFRQAFKVKNDKAAPTRTMQRTLIVEECKEFLDAENQIIPGFGRNEEDALKELADLVYVCFQYAVNMGWDLDTALDRVHRSNMSKLGSDGLPIYREDGKVLKGPNYKEPTLSDLV